jgi:hypothetical protein
MLKRLEASPSMNTDWHLTNSCHSHDAGARFSTGTDHRFNE